MSSLDRITLFRTGNFILHSGERSNFKIDCDALTQDDYKSLAVLIASKFIFHFAYAVAGGTNPSAKLVDELNRQCLSSETNMMLLVDDVLTTGRSMEEAKDNLMYDLELTESQIQGIVIFSRMKIPPTWIFPVFTLNV